MAHLEKTAIFLVKAYQKHAPPQMRNHCRFKPSCSEYMILAIEKYGLQKGVGMGIKRINRCRFPNGGVDYP